MKTPRWISLIGCLCVALGAGCMTADAGGAQAPAEQSTTEVTQDIGDGDPLCDAWARCYSRCGLCTNPQTCAAQLICLTNCDTFYYPAPSYCPYPF